MTPGDSPTAVPSLPVEGVAAQAQLVTVGGPFASDLTVTGTLRYTDPVTGQARLLTRSGVINRLNSGLALGFEIGNQLNQLSVPGVFLFSFSLDVEALLLEALQPGTALNGATVSLLTNFSIADSSSLQSDGSYLAVMTAGGGLNGTAPPPPALVPQLVAPTVTPVTVARAAREGSPSIPGVAAKAELVTVGGPFSSDLTVAGTLRYPDPVTGQARVVTQSSVINRLNSDLSIGFELGNTLNQLSVAGVFLFSFSLDSVTLELQALQPGTALNGATVSLVTNFSIADSSLLQGDGSYLTVMTAAGGLDARFDVFPSQVVTPAGVAIGPTQVAAAATSMSVSPALVPTLPSVPQRPNFVPEVIEDGEFSRATLEVIQGNHVESFPIGATLRWTDPASSQALSVNMNVQIPAGATMAQITNAVALYFNAPIVSSGFYQFGPLTTDTLVLIATQVGETFDGATLTLDSEFNVFEDSVLDGSSYTLVVTTAGGQGALLPPAPTQVQGVSNAAAQPPQQVPLASAAAPIQPAVIPNPAL